MSTYRVFELIVDIAAYAAFGCALWKISSTPGQGTIAFALIFLLVLMPIGARRR